MATTDQSREQSVVEAVHAAAVHRRRVARRVGRRDARRSRTRRRARRSPRSPTRTPEDAHAALDAAAGAQAEWAATAPRERGEILRRAYETIDRARRRPGAADDARDGQAASPSRKAEITYAADFFRWFAERGGAHRRPLRGRRERRATALLVDEAAGRPVRADHAVELPDGDGHAQDRPGGRGGLHDGRQAGASRRRCRCSRSRRSSRRPGCPAGVLNVITAKSVGRGRWSR